MVSLYARFLLKIGLHFNSLSCQESVVMFFEAVIMEVCFTDQEEVESHKRVSRKLEQFVLLSMESNFLLMS